MDLGVTGDCTLVWPLVRQSPVVLSPLLVMQASHYGGSPGCALRERVEAAVAVPLTGRLNNCGGEV